MLGLGLLTSCAASPAPKAPASPSPTSGVAAVQTPAVAPTVDGVATLTEGYCKCATLHMISLGGNEVGSVTLAPGVLPPIANGTNGIYYVLGYQLMRLDDDGSTAIVGTVATAPTSPGVSVGPAPEQGSLAMAPGATEWGYLQSVSSGTTQTQQLWLGEPNRAPKLLVSSPEGAAQASSEFPNGWSLQLLGWSDGSLVLAQVPTGSESFASQALEVSLVNPQTRAETLLTNSQNCPISAVSGTGSYLCFQQGGGQATELETGLDGISTGAWSLPAGADYGAATFNSSATQILFANCNGCGAGPSAADLSSQMEVLDLTTGSLVQIAGTGLVPDAWLPNGQIVATKYTKLAYAVKGAAPLSEVVLVDGSTGQITALSDDSTSQFVGIATS
ncbi:MAG: hypothetical protein WBZ07_11060 [Candidatus Dormiibacterota bacterium]